MTTSIAIVDGPLPPRAPEREERGRSGARLLFEGLVRADESGRTIAGLHYEIYEPMASRTLAELAQACIVAHGVHAIAVEHSRGDVPVGGCSFRLVVLAEHRAEALAAAADFIDRMKRDAPIWKRPIEP